MLVFNRASIMAEPDDAGGEAMMAMARTVSGSTGVWKPPMSGCGSAMNGPTAR
jgi:hypothetical protein